MKYTNLSGYTWYGGAPIVALRDASGVLFIGGCAYTPYKTDGDDFRYIVVKCDSNDKPSKRLSLPDESAKVAGRGILFVDAYTGKGMYSATMNNALYCDVIPEFAQFTTSLTIVTDEAARSMATSAVTTANNALSKVTTLTSIVDKLAAQVSGETGISESTVKDIVWSLSADRLFAELQNASSPLRSMIWSQAKDAAYAQLKEAGLIHG